MSLFGILGAGVSGLSAAQQAMDVIGQNIANATTPGYSRQRANLVSGQATSIPSISVAPVTVMDGVSVSTIERIKSSYLQDTADTASSKQSALLAQTTPLSNAEKLFAEPGDTGLQAAMDSFYSVWGDIANPTADGAGAAGQIVLARGVAVASQLNGVSTSLDAQWASSRAVLQGMVGQANAAASTLAALNSQISAGQVANININALLDQRDQVVTKLANLVGGTSSVSDNGQVSVSISGVSLVSGVHAETMTLNAGPTLASVGQLPPSLQVGTVVASPSSGQAAGLLAALGTDLPSISAQLDNVANALRDAVNTLQGQGFTAAGDPGTDFFSGTGAGDLAVALTSPDQLAVSSAAGTADVSNAQRMSDLVDDATAAAVLGSPGASALWRSLTTSVGAQIQGLTTAQTTQIALVATTQGAVEADSGVSLDEELTNMLLFQRSYQASAKIITVTDEMLQTLLGMGA